MVRGCRILVVIAVVGSVPASSSAPRLVFVDVENSIDIGVEGIEAPNSVALSPDGAHLYVASSGTGVAGEDGAVAVFLRDPASGEIHFVQAQRDGLGNATSSDGPRSVAVSPDGEHVYTGLGNGSLVAYSRNSLTGALAFVETESDGVNGVDGIDGVNGTGAVAVSPDGKHVYVAGAADDAVAVFSRDDTTGELSFVELQKDGIASVDGLSGANGVVVSADGEHVYAVGTDDDGLAVFTRNAADGRLSFVEAHEDGVDGVDGLDGANSVAVSPDGANVYTSASPANAVAVFSRNPVSGRLTFVRAYRDDVDGVDGLSGAISVGVDPRGRVVHVTGFGEHALALFVRAGDSLVFADVAKLFGPDPVPGLGSARSGVMSPDGRDVYAVGLLSEAVVALRVAWLGLFRADAAPLPVPFSPSGPGASAGSGGRRPEGR